MSDCINTGEGFGGGGLQFTDLANPASKAVKCLAIGTGFGDYPIDPTHADRCVVFTKYSYTMPEREMAGTSLIGMSLSEIGNTEYMSSGFPYDGRRIASPDFEIGADKRWAMGTGTSPFPIPNKSTYIP